MQVNTYFLENLSDMTNSNNGKKGVQASKDIDFFGVVLEKADIKKTPDFLGYDKSGSDMEKGSSNGQAAQEMSKQDLLAYINQNIDTLKDLVTDEDYSAMSELGLAPDKEDPHTLVTVYERIQIQLAAFCDDYDGYTSGISREKMEAVLGSKPMADALKMASEAGELSGEAKSYLLKNELEPTIENVYKAVHVTQTGRDRQAAQIDPQQWEELKPQIVQMMEKSGMDVTQESLDNARWLMEQQIPVTAENMIKIAQLNRADMQSETLQTNVAFALMFGMSGTSAYVTEGWINPAEAAEAQKVIGQVDDEVIYDIVDDDVKLNVANIKKYQEKSDSQNEEHGSAGQDAQKNRNYEDISFIRAKSVVVQARLMMTAASFLNMQKVGINITYTDIWEMTSETQALNETYYDTFFEGNVKTPEYTESVSSVMEIMRSMSQVPSAVIGQIYNEKISFTISSIYEESNRLSANFTKAELTYEAVGTQVRTDLGDSMQKAFDSIDGILRDQNIEVNESSRRAARILAYNQLEINKQSVLKMEAMMTELDYVRDNLVPKTAALLVEHQVNILNTDIHQLNQNLVELNAMVGAGEEEDFARYLWKLEKSGNITDEKREEYVDLYRTLNMVESTDARAIGAVAATGAEFTLGNLLAAVKSQKKKGMDVTVDEKFGLSQREELTEADEQEIGEFVRKMAARIKSGLNTDTIEKAYKKDSFYEISLGNLVDIVSENESLKQNQKLNAEYVKQVMDNYLREADTQGISEETVLTLLEGGHKATVENIISALEMSMPGSDYKKYLLDKKNKEVALAAEEILDNFEDEKQAKEAFEHLKETAALKNMSSTNMSYDQIKMMSDINRNLRFMAESAANESYHIPVEIDGEAMNIRVSFVHDDGVGKVNLSMNTAQFGKIECTIQSVNSVTGVRMQAVIYCESAELEGRIARGRYIFVQNVESVAGTAEFSLATARRTEKVSGDIIRKNWREELENEQDRKEEEKINTGYLYKVSKSMIKSVKECLEKIR